MFNDRPEERDKLSVRTSIRSDTGCVRESNEDHGHHVSPRDPDVLDRRGSLTIVADGMGGHSSGEVAATLAVDIISRGYYAPSDLAPRDVLAHSITEANREIYEASLKADRFAGMGTTIIALVVRGDKAFWAHVGDARLYLLRKQRLHVMTIDHSQVMEMVQQGIITLQQAQGHSDKNIVSRALGTQPEVEIEFSDDLSIEPGDVFLLCSDGLNDMVPDDAIEEILLNEGDEHHAADRLIEAAKNNGGHDNVTVGVVKVASAAMVPPRQPARITREVEVLQR